jgi:hypothetical protein
MELISEVVEIGDAGVKKAYPSSKKNNPGKGRLEEIRLGNIIPQEEQCRPEERGTGSAGSLRAGRSAENASRCIRGGG